MCHHRRKQARCRLLDRRLFGVLRAAGTPRAIVDRLNAEINRVLQDPKVVKERLNSVGLSPVGTTPERYMENHEGGPGEYAKITKDAGIKPDQ